MIDDLDRKILARLVSDGRTPYGKIGDEVGVSESTVFVRVKKMLEAGVITRFTVSLDPEKVNRSLGCFILVNADPNLYEDVLEDLEGLPEVLEIHDLAGRYDILLKARTPSRTALTHLLDVIGGMEGVDQTQTSIVLRTLKEEPLHPAEPPS
jgi:DNA-binding Lrp family transcriptional regulator